VSDAPLHASGVAQAILLTHKFAQDPSGELYVFQSGHHQPRGEQYIKRRIKQLVIGWGKEPCWKSKLATEVCEFIRADAPELWAKPPADVVNVENGLLNVLTRELLPHSPAHLTPVQLPVKYDPQADGAVWKRFVQQTFPADAQDVAWEIAAWTMTPYAASQKAVCLVGDGSNGKSAYFAGLTAFLGAPNVCAVSLHKLQTDRFAASRVVGKLANICPDLPNQKLAASDMFKALTGGDVIHAERKYRDAFEFRPHAKLIFAANHLPSSDDASHAFFRRWLIVRFVNTFQPGDAATLPREVLDAMLATPEALSGLLNLALDAVPRLRSQGFTISPTIMAECEEFRSAGDPFVVWLDRYLIDDPKGTIPKRDLIDAYSTVCNRANRPVMNDTAFGRALRRARPSITDCQITVVGNKQEAYRGITWNWDATF
jgi:P4 family phage/plasmid primase-like protien